VGLAGVARPRRPALPPLPRHGHPGDRGAGDPQPPGLRRVPADDERLRAAPSARPRVERRSRRSSACAIPRTWPGPSPSSSSSGS
jgi:hypothetical protein